MGLRRRFFAPSGKGSETVPVKAAKRCVTQYGRDHVGPTPEFRTSIACSGCYTRHTTSDARCVKKNMKKPRRRREKEARTGKPYRSPHRVSVRGLKRCSNTACENFRNRDKHLGNHQEVWSRNTTVMFERGSVLPGTKTIDILRVSKKTGLLRAKRQSPCMRH
jgi:uncharacterized protein YjhX (UPF0386 family)